MHLRSLYLQNFRNYREAYVEFSPSVNFICGPNAQGKTTLLEAIHYLMIGRSFRARLPQELIRIGEQAFFLEAIFSKENVEQTLRVHVEGKSRKMRHNQTFLPNSSSLLGIMQGVLMTPDDIDLIKGSPSTRRQFLDIQLAQSDPLYVHYLSRYIRAMRQRNHLLKQKAPATLESWEHEMAQAASYLVMQRRHLLTSLQLHCQVAHQELTGETQELQLKYISSVSQCKDEHEIKQKYIEHMKKNRIRELSLGYTLSGPHKDDFWIGIGELDARYFASEGQQRSCVAALRIGEWKRLKESLGDFPLFMLDDIGISLDQNRKERLIEHLAHFGQVFLTTHNFQLLEPFKGSKKILKLPFDS